MDNFFWGGQERYSFDSLLALWRHH
jgi:hypothetical protein